jgi:hypothetical protein
MVDASTDPTDASLTDANVGDGPDLVERADASTDANVGDGPDLGERDASLGGPAPRAAYHRPWGWAPDGPSWDAASSSCGTPDVPAGVLPYQGGSVMPDTTNVYIIWYEPGQFAPFSDQAVLGPFLGDLSESSYTAIATTFGVLGQLTLNGEYPYPSDSAAANLDFAAIGAIVQSVVQQSAPLDPTGLYIVRTPPGVTQSNGAAVGSFCDQYCAWHSTRTMVKGGVSANIKFAFVGDPAQCPALCQWGAGAAETPNGDAVDSSLSMVAHELFGMLTDPNLDAYGYADDGGALVEGADLCAWRAGTTFPVTLQSGPSATANIVLNNRPFLLQMQWVNESSGYGSNGYGLPFWGAVLPQADQNYGFPNSLASSDWSWLNYKAQCSSGQFMIGVSQDPHEAHANTIHCGSVSQTANADGGGTCHGVLFDPQDDLETSVDGDWDLGYSMAECDTTEYAAGLSQSQSGAIDGLLCCVGNVSHSSCTPTDVDYRQTSADLADRPWAFGDYVGQCPPGQYLAGISATPAGTSTGNGGAPDGGGSPGAPHRLLCCSP